MATTKFHIEILGVGLQSAGQRVVYQGGTTNENHQMKLQLMFVEKEREKARKLGRVIESNKSSQAIGGNLAQRGSKNLMDPGGGV